ncbi:acyltransferase family protein [Aeromicrobium piscarium]|uniref:acyltransferase family protein n=1 Tax=Aeromicrobium piscarium TaxID=2590901 RepID=UPI00163DC726|nr:acyltransferase family protein [Aeromicrobium piscarium]
MSATLPTRSAHPEDTAERAARPARHLAALDGLRAVAVLLVLGYHADPDRFPGGFVGVDVFFVLSGFLITALILREMNEHGRVALRRFWARRIRRLAPALLVMVAVTSSITLAVGNDTGAGLRSQVIGALTWTSNWIQIHEGWSYADASVPPLLNHLWSLGIEEQFYLLWPVLILGLLTVARRAVAQRVVAVLALVSVGLMAFWYLTADPTRAYMGLDSHAFGLLLGATVALGTAPHLLRDGFAAAAEKVRYTALGAVGLVAIVVYALVVEWDSQVTFLGGLALVNLATVGLVLAAANPTPIARFLGWSPLRWVGERSYGIYLWHWPLIVFATRLMPAEHRVVAGWAAVLIAVPVAALSYRFVELPLRRDGARATLTRWAAQVRGDDRVYRARRARPLAIAGLAVLLTASTALWKAPSESDVEAALREGQRAVSASIEASDETPEASAPTEAPPPAPDACRAVDAHEAVSAFGDSVTVAVAPALLERRPGSSAVAVVGWQYGDVAAAVREAAAQDQLRPTVLIATGTNGEIDQADLDALVANELADRQVGLVAPYVPGRSWSDQSLAAARAVAEAHANVHLIDWNALASQHPEITGTDQVHPTGHGQGVFVDQVGQALAIC